nr:hypothetical protein [Lachnospiraceae bacterium]
MDNRELLRALGGAAEKYVNEAEPQETETTAKPRIRKPLIWGTAAAACVLIAVLALTGGWFRRQKGEEPGLMTETSQQGKNSVENPAKNSSGAQLISSSEAQENQDRILYQDDRWTVKDITGLPADSSGPEYIEQGELRYFTDRELMEESDVILRGRLTGRRIVEITNVKSDFSQYASILTVEPLRVLKGELKHEGPIEIYVQQPGRNESTYGTDWALKNAKPDSEGILLLHELSYEFQKALADYDGWAPCFAVWGAGDGIALPQHYFASYDKNWTLDEAEARTKTLLGDGEDLPADFAFCIDYRYEGESREHDQGFSYDSVSGRMEEILSFAGDLRMRTAVFNMEESDRKLFRDCLERLKDFPEEIVHEKGEFGEIFRVEIRWQEDGRQYSVRYRGGAMGYGNSYNKQMGVLSGAVREMQHIFEECREDFVDVRHAELLPYSREGYAQLQKENRAEGTGLWAAEETPGDILYSDEYVTVRKASGSGMETRQEYASLAYLTERELFTGGLTLVAELTDAEDVEIVRKEEDPLLTGLGPGRATLLTIKPVQVLYGDLPAGDSIRVLVDQCLNSSLENRSLSGASAWIGRKAIFMIYPVAEPAEGEEALAWRGALANYTVGDNLRFAIWETAGGLSYLQSAFPGLSKTWSLDQAADYVREVTAPDVTVPEDFYIEFSCRYWDEDGNEYLARYYDSRSGQFSCEGSDFWEEEYGGDHMTTVFPEDRMLLSKLYLSCLRLKDLPEELNYMAVRAGAPDSREVRIRFCLDGQEKEIRFTGLYYVPEWAEDDLQRLDQSETEIRYYLDGCKAMLAWQEELEPVRAARRLARSQQTAAALEAALEAQYGPGGAPDFYLGYHFSYGYLEICLKTAPDDRTGGAWIREIWELLPPEAGSYLLMSCREDEIPDDLIRP